MASQEQVVYTALGTNLGDKLRNLEGAIDMLRSLVGPIVATSRLYCTAPQYVEDQPSFFNIVVKLTTALAPEPLLEAFKYIEREIGRVESFRYGPRLIDVDVLFYGDKVVTTTTVDGPLIIPHERIHERDFVLAPFCDVAPDFVHPGLNVTMRELYTRLIATATSGDASTKFIPPIVMMHMRGTPKTMTGLKV
uniref:2-amino-4-hydroxy-6-hydroxymethyldihydropteridine diphosphokinase n=1 Tax=Globisporangium ultimum (strain ATCC 200006 / CBS 805.95 / DAOM BR144) TaxID=431595 RepID=K3X1N3_GLOUD